MPVILVCNVSLSALTLALQVHHGLRTPVNIELKRSYFSGKRGRCYRNLPVGVTAGEFYLLSIVGRYSQRDQQAACPDNCGFCLLKQE